MNKSSAADRRLAAVDAFQRTEQVPPRARILLVHMLCHGLVGLKDGVWGGGVAKLAASVGCSPGGVSASLKELVFRGFLVRGVKHDVLTIGRKVYTYGVGPKLKEGPAKRPLHSWALQRVLFSQDGAFAQLSAVERCILGHLWLALITDESMLGVDRGRVCVVTGVSIRDLAKRCGISRETAKRGLLELQRKSLVEAPVVLGIAFGTVGITKTYFLLEPAMVKGVAEVKSFVIEKEKISVWPAVDEEDQNFKSMIASFCGLEINDENPGELMLSLQRLNSRLIRSYIFIGVCAALSNAYLWQERNKVLADRWVGEMLLRCLGLPRSGPGKAHLGIEWMEIPDELRLLYDCVEGLSIMMTRGFIDAMSSGIESLRAGGRSPAYVCCNPVFSGGDFSIRVDVIFV